jgi:hypothetical protein
MEEDRHVEGGVGGSVMDKTTGLDGEVPGERGEMLKAQGAKLKAQETNHHCGF